MFLLESLPGSSMACLLSGVYAVIPLVRSFERVIHGVSGCVTFLGSAAPVGRRVEIHVELLIQLHA